MAQKGFINKANQLKKERKFDEAIVEYQNLIKSNPNFSWGYIGLGEIMSSQDRLDEAVLLFKKSLSINPNSPYVYYQLSLILAKQNKIVQATSFVKISLNLKPDSWILNNTYGWLLLKRGYIYTAVSYLQKGLELNPNFFWLHYNLGDAYLRQERFDEAISCVQQAINLDPLSSKAQNKLGEILLEQGEITKAIGYFHKAIAINPNAAWYYQNLGNAVAQTGSFKQSRACYTRAIQINPNEVKRYHDSLFIKPCISKDMVKKPIFIVGCGHSGTSILLAILGDHPSFHPIPQESNLFMKSDHETRSTLCQWDRECREAGKKRWIEKTPTHIFQIGKLSLYRPESQFIIMLRDGRDVVCSLKARIPNALFSTMVDRWIYDNLAGLQYWNNSMVKVVRYENLVANPQEILKDVCEFLQEEYTPSMLDYHKTPRFWYSDKIQEPETHIGQDVHTQLRNWQINQPIFDGRGKWKTEMTEEEKAIFKDKAQKYLEQFGYVENDSW